MHKFVKVRWILASYIVTIIGTSAKKEDAPTASQKCSKQHIVTTKPANIAFVWTPKEDPEEHFCHWTLSGTKDCDVAVECNLDLTKVDDDCTEGAFIKISDGSGGEKIYCGSTSFSHKPSDSTLRDMFLKLKVPEGYSGKGVACKAQCASHVNGAEPLPKNIEKKHDLRCVCGLQNKDDRIVGGEDAMLNEFPWQAAVVFANTRSPMCGAAVINNQYVMCAAHCFAFDKRKPETIEVLIHAHTLDMTKKKSAKNVALGKDGSIQSSGYNLTKKTDADEKTQRYKVAEIINHPQFSDSYDYDIAVLKLAKKIDLGDPDAPTPICLPPPNQMGGSYESNLLTDQMVTVVGWGLAAENAGGTTRVLQKLDIPYVPDDPCVKSSPDLITARMICAGYMDGTQKDACTGDSGGPLIFKQSNKQFVQVGVVSWGEGCARKGKPGVYARVSDLMQWVHFHTISSDTKWCQEQK